MCASTQKRSISLAALSAHSEQMRQFATHVACSVVCVWGTQLYKNGWNGRDAVYRADSCGRIGTLYYMMILYNVQLDSGVVGTLALVGRWEHVWWNRRYGWAAAVSGTHRRRRQHGTRAARGRCLCPSTRPTAAAAAPDLRRTMTMTVDASYTQTRTARCFFISGVQNHR